MGNLWKVVRQHDSLNSSLHKALQRYMPISPFATDFNTWKKEHLPVAQDYSNWCKRNNKNVWS